MSTALMFFVIALFFTLITYVPGYRIEGPETFDRFAKSAQLSALVGSGVGVLFFLKQMRSGWPWLLTSAFFMLNGYLQAAVDQAGRTQFLTMAVGSIGELPAVVIAVAGAAGLIWAAWKAAPVRQRGRAVAVVLLAATSSPVLAQSVASSCAGAIRAVQDGPARTGDLDLIASACPGDAARVHAEAVRAARDTAAERPVRLAALRVLVTGLRPEVSLSGQWLATARLGDLLPRRAHGGGAAEGAATPAQVEAVRSTVAQLARSDADAEVRRASLVLLQALVHADSTLAAVDADAVRLVAGCADRVRLETTSDISVPYVVRVEGTAFVRTIWMKPPPAGEASRIDLALPAGVVTVTVADRVVARLDGRPGPCP